MVFGMFAKFLVNSRTKYSKLRWFGPDFYSINSIVIEDPIRRGSMHNVGLDAQDLPLCGMAEPWKDMMTMEPNLEYYQPNM